MKYEHSWEIFEKYSNIKSHKNPSSGSRAILCGRAGGRTDIQTDVKLIVAFRYFANAPKMISPSWMANNLLKPHSIGIRTKHQQSAGWGGVGLGISSCESFPFNYIDPVWDSISVHHTLYTATFSATNHPFLLKSEMVSLLTLTAEFRSETSCCVGLCKDTRNRTFSPFQPRDDVDYTRAACSPHRYWSAPMILTAQTLLQYAAFPDWSF